MESETISPTWTARTPSSKENNVETIEKLKANIPDHLKEFIVEQDTTDYTPVDHAVWRYILRQLKNYLAQNAHHCYLEGLEKTGITVDEIPSIDSICKKLQNFGWSAIPVSGFIPPAAFMELQSLGVLPIATDMRSIDHLLYTPAPDIVHEAAGHAPILINPEFAKYLKQYANVAKQAIVSSEDLGLYEAIRELSDIKEHPESTEEQIAQANDKLNKTVEEMSVVSEATLLGRMNWWTAEYGLIGSITDPKIYGAGLLSSYGEAKDCLKRKVRKIPLSIDCVNFSYDITEPQPQLFVARNFAELTNVLQELSLQMSYKKGGIFGLKKAIEAKTVNTVQLNSGLQVSGKVVEYFEKEEECIYFRCEGPTQLCIGNTQLDGHDKTYHSQGYSTPLGFVEGIEDCLSWASDEDLESIGVAQGKKCQLRFESGIKVSGKLEKVLRSRRKELCVMTFSDCTVTYDGKTLFKPEWGTFDMAVGSQIDSVFSGPADRKSYGQTDSFAKKRVAKRKLSPEDLDLNTVFQELRDLRKSGKTNLGPYQKIFAKLEKDFQHEWLLRVELLEMTHLMEDSFGKDGLEFRQTLRTSLKKIMQEKPEYRTVIEDGLILAPQVL